MKSEKLLKIGVFAVFTFVVSAVISFVGCQNSQPTNAANNSEISTPEASIQLSGIDDEAASQWVEAIAAFKKENSVSAINFSFKEGVAVVSGNLNLITQFIAYASNDKSSGDIVLYGRHWYCFSLVCGGMPFTCNGLYWNLFQASLSLAGKVVAYGCSGGSVSSGACPGAPTCP